MSGQEQEPNSLALPRPRKGWILRPSSPMLIIIMIATIGLALRLFIVFRDLNIVDRLFVPDDTYYTLSIARSIAHGLGPSVDGQQLTNGFQPLLAFLMVPVFWIADSPDVSLRVALLFSALCGLANALLLGQLALRMAGYRAGLAAAAMWSFSPVALAASLDGLETSLALTISLALVELWCRANIKKGRRHYIGVGFFAGLALLARVDTVFLVGLLGLFEFIHGSKRRLFIAVIVAALVVAPWWSYSISNFSTVIPESGAAVKKQVQFHQSLYLNLSEQVAWTAGTLVGGPITYNKSLQDYLNKRPITGCFLAILLLAFYLILIGWVYKKKRAPWPILALAFHGLLIAFFYTFYLPALWFFRRYLHPTGAVVALLIAVLAAEVWNRRKTIRLAFPVLLAFSLCLLGALVQSTLFIWTNPPMTPDVALHGAKGYREVAQDIFKRLPEKAVLGAFQSGALSFYGRPRFEVVNLDGVVDGKAGQAVKEHRLGEYAESRGVTHFADWPLNYWAFRYFGGREVEGAKFRKIAEARLQGTERTVLSEIVWRPSE